MIEWLKYCLSYKIMQRFISELQNDRLLLQQRLDERGREVHQLRDRLRKQERTLQKANTQLRGMKGKVTKMAKLAYPDN